MHPILASFLERQHIEGMRLADSSDVLTLVPRPGTLPPRDYLAHFESPTMVRRHSAIQKQTGYDVLISLPLDYVRSPPDPATLIALLAPRNAVHPNVLAPFMCIGEIAPGTPLCELLYRIYEVMSFQRFTPNEFDALDKEACGWARANFDLFPLTEAPLRRRGAAFEIDGLEAGGIP